MERLISFLITHVGKVLHVLLGGWIGLWGVPLAAYLHHQHSPRWVFGLCVLLAAIAGVLKEVYDYLKNQSEIAAGQPPTHGVELSDVFITASGGVYVGLVACVALYITG